MHKYIIVATKIYITHSIPANTIGLQIPYVTGLMSP